MDLETDQQKSANFYKLISLLVDIGGEALRDVLLKEIPQNQLAVVILQNHNLLSDLKRLKVLTEPQYDLLQERQPDPLKFDISLLVALLRNICPNIEAPTPDWKVKVPAQNDLSIGAEILRIRNIRNSNLHIPATMMPKATFTPLWNELESIIIRISIKVSQATTNKVVRKISQLEHSEVDPSGEKEKKLLQQFKDWQTQITDILSEKINSLKSSLESLHMQNESVLDVVDAVRQTGDGMNEKLSSIQEQLMQVTQDVSRMSLPQAAGDHNYSETRHADFEELRQLLQVLQRDVISIKQHIQRVYSAQTTTQWQNTVQNPPPQVSRSQPPRGPESLGDLSQRDIDEVAGKVGFDWERLALFLDYNQGQIDTIKQIYKDQPVTRNVRLIQDWSNIVTRCGESPRTLLAAAFASMENNEMAQLLVPAEEVEGIKDKEASEDAKGRIREIVFENRPQLLGNTSRQTPVGAVGGNEGFNIFDGDVTLGSVAIHSSLNSTTSGPSDRSFPSSIPDSNQNANIGGYKSINIFGGNVRTKDGETIHIGQASGPSVVYTRNPDICRGEGIDHPEGGDPVASAGTSSGNLKKTVDNTFSETIFNKYNEAMKSVGVLASENSYGTVFRVGSKYVMTAWHVVHGIIDPLKSGVVDWNRLKDKARVIFSSHIFTSNLTFCVKDVLPVDQNFDNVADLDIVILELDNSANLPPRLNLHKHKIDIIHVPSVDIIGYGHPKSHTKTLDPNCRIVLPEDHSLQAAHAWLQQNKNRLAQGLGLQTIPTKVDWSFSGYDKAESIIFNCFLEKGSSGAPLFTTVPGDPLVVGVVIKGLPSCFWDLSSTSQQMFPDKYRFEMGIRMNHIYGHLLLSKPGLADDLFQ